MNKHNASIFLRSIPMKHNTQSHHKQLGFLYKHTWNRNKKQFETSSERSCCARIFFCHFKTDFSALVFNCFVYVECYVYFHQMQFSSRNKRRFQLELSTRSCVPLLTFCVMLNLLLKFVSISFSLILSLMHTMTMFDVMEWNFFRLKTGALSSNVRFLAGSEQRELFTTDKDESECSHFILVALFV